MTPEQEIDEMIRGKSSEKITHTASETRACQQPYCNGWCRLLPVTMKNEDCVYTAMVFSRTERCRCGSGYAYWCGADSHDGWFCARRMMRHVLIERYEVDETEHSESLPFVFWKVARENEDLSTRPTSCRRADCVFRGGHEGPHQTASAVSPLVPLEAGWAPAADDSPSPEVKPQQKVETAYTGLPMRLVDVCYGMTGGDLYVCDKCGSRAVVRAEAPAPRCQPHQSEETRNG